MNRYARLRGFTRLVALPVFCLMTVAMDANAAAVAEQRIDTLPFTITQPGHYVLSTSLRTPANGIEIAADDVVLDLGGHSIDGSKATDNAFFGIYAYGRKGLTIKNGSISGFSYAVYVSGHADAADTAEDLGKGGHLIEHLKVSDSTFRGIRVEGSDSIVRDNTLSDIGGTSHIADGYAMGIEVYGNRVLVSDNDIEEVRGSGVRDVGEGVGISLTSFVSGAVVRNNRIANRALQLTPQMPAWLTRSRSTYGIWVGGDGATAVRVEGNTISNFQQGITFKRSESGAFANNAVTHAFIPYYLPANQDGKRVRDLGGNTSDEQHLTLKHGRSTPGQIETVEPEYATYLSPLHRLRDHAFLAVPNLTAGDDTLVANGQATMVDYWYPPIAGQAARPVHVDLEKGSASGCCGNDRLVGMRGAQGTPYNDVLLGNAQSNLLAGGEGDDRLEGLAGDDFLFGDAGNDQLFGGEGDDVLDGGPGDDILWGGPGADTFLFWGNQATGDDVIMDFSGHGAEQDVIDLTGNVASFEQLMQVTDQQGDDAVILLSTGTLTLKNVRKEQLVPQDFIF